MGSMRTDRFAGVFGESLVVRRAAHPRLHPHVYGYTGYQERTIFTRRREAPTGAVTGIVDLGEGLTVVDPTCPDHRRGRLMGFLVGPADHPFLVDSGGQQSGVQFDLTPIGARLLLNRPLCEITNRAVTLEELFGAAGGVLVERLRSADSWEARFELLDEELGGRFATASDLSPDLAWTWHAMVRSRGRVTVGALANQVGCSRKHLIGRFHAQLGLPPKRVASILRFQRAVELIEHGALTGLAEVAAACGYYDQAHLDRDFRRYAGITPSEHRRLYMPDFGVRAN